MKRRTTKQGLETVVKDVANGKTVTLSPKLKEDADRTLRMKSLIEIHSNSTKAVKAFREEFHVSIPTAYSFYHKAEKLLQTTNPIKEKDLNVQILITLVLEALHDELSRDDRNNAVVDRLLARYDSIIEKYMGDSNTIDWDTIKPFQNILRFKPSDFGYDDNVNPNELKERALRQIERFKKKAEEVLDVDFEQL